MITKEDRTKCTGCHACFSICPSHSITMVPDVAGFLYPSVDESACVHCNLCGKVCPIVLSSNPLSPSLEVGYAAYNKDEEIRRSSSSGGIFSQIALSILNKGGVVVGAVMDDDNRGVHHQLITSKQKVYLLQGSKYTQSKLGDVLKQTRDELKKGRLVLFTGTPCQISGLYSFLGEYYSNLYTQDIICHGVPSPEIYREYIKYQENKYGSIATDIQFRSKDKGWSDYEVMIQFENNKVYRQKFYKDSYMAGFLQDIFLRPSCYSCIYKTKQRPSDVTLADFWGIQHVYPEMDDNRGISFVWIHTEKGQRLFDEIKNNVVFQSVNCDSAIHYNPSAISTPKQKPCSEEIVRALKHENFIDVLRKYTKLSPSQFIKKAVSRIKHLIVKS